MGAPSASLLQRLQDAQTKGRLGDIVGHEEAGAWGNRDLSSASYEDLVGAFGASDLMDPAAADPSTPPSSMPPSPLSSPTVPSPIEGGGTPSSGTPGSGTGTPSALSMMSGMSGMSAPGGNPPAGWMDTGGGMGGGSLGTRQYPQQGTALSRMARRTGRVY